MLGLCVRVKVVKPIGSVEKQTGYVYPLNYGCVENNRRQFAFIMGVHHPVSNFDGRVIATLTNKKEQRCIWILAPKSSRFIVNDIKEYLNLDKDFPHYKLECLYEHSCGAVVYRDVRGQIKYLLIKNKRSAHWGFPKGHIEDNETKRQAAMREVLEETGIHVNIIDGFECVSKYKIQGRIEKIVTLYVGTTRDTATNIQAEEIEDYVWLTYDRAISLLKFENDQNILTAAHHFLNKNNYV